MLELFFLNPLAFIILFGCLVLAISVHEFSHAWMADHLGDPTARLSGRLTLNPKAHLDPLGVLALLFFGFGWGKPVPIDPYNLRSPRRDAAFISLAGPASNLILAVILALVLKFVPYVSLFSLLATIITPLIELNVALAIFNLLPIPPLDGSKIIVGFISSDLAWRVEEALDQSGYFLLILFLLPILGGMSLATIIIVPIINLILKILLPLSI